ncbi:MAG: hypothetical protein GQ570_06625 [Helicobacteraceae bacterium]|nr:hypothetical protein [Helicobacteraceae bacterium]
MVRVLLLTTLFFASLNASLLTSKIESLIGKDNYAKNRSFIKIIFSDEKSYYSNSSLDSVKVIETLKENGLLNLFFKKPKTFEITFSTNGVPLFFVKLMSDTLRSMGYYRYITKSSNLNSSEFSWTVAIKSEYATDPLSLRKELAKRGCSIVDIERISGDKWHYSIDMRYAKLKTKKILQDEVKILKHANQDYWVDVSKIKKLTIWSLKGNTWYPYISYYDKHMRLLKVYKRDHKTWQITINLPQECVYVKLSDLYSLKNIKGGLKLKAIGQK